MLVRQSPCGFTQAVTTDAQQNAQNGHKKLAAFAGPFRLELGVKTKKTQKGFTHACFTRIDGCVHTS